MGAGTPVHFELMDNIDLSNTDWVNDSSVGYVIFTNFNGTFEGNGHTISANLPTGQYYYIFNNVGGESSISNLNMDTSGSSVSLIAIVDGADLKVENVDILGYAESVANNDVPYIVWAWGNISFIDCDNYASWNITGYSGIYTGQFSSNGMNTFTITFSGCDNYGTITGTDVAMFVGNPSNMSDFTFIVYDSFNYGLLIGSASASLFSTYNGSTTLASYNSQYADCNKGTISNFRTIDADVTADPTTHEITVDVNESEIVSYTINITATGTLIYDDAYGTLRINVTSDILAIGTSSGVYAALFVDKNTATLYGIPVSELSYSNQYSGYNVAYYDGCYIIDAYSYSDFFINKTVTAEISFYDAQGEQCGVCTMSIADITSTTPSTFHYVTVSPDESYTIDAKSLVIESGSDFNFKIIPSVLYTGTPDVYYKISTSEDWIPINANDDGSYTIHNVTSDIIIEVSGLMQSTFTVNANLTNVVLSNSVGTVKGGDSYESTIILDKGYSLASITVTMGSEIIQTTGTTIYIPEVTDNIYITVVAEATDVDDSNVPFPPIWDDDDEYVPPIVPVQPEDSSDDTTAIVACAAAAVVAALIAVYLIIDRKH